MDGVRWMLDVDISCLVGQGRPRVGRKHQVQNDIFRIFGDVKMRRIGLNCVEELGFCH